MKKLRHFLEYFIAKVLLAFFSTLSFQMASDVGAKLSIILFSKSKRNQIARKNISYAMPELSANQIDCILTEMWDNLGRNFAELPHINKLSSEHIQKLVEISGINNISTTKKAALYFTAHLGNWEIAPKVFFDLGNPVNIVYRQANNPGLEKIIQKIRSKYVINTLPKGPDGSREVIKQLRQGNPIGMLVDQKMNDGVKIDFFGHMAMTAPAIARLAIKYQCPIIPVRVVRHNKHKFKVIVLPHMEIPDTNNRDNDIIEAMTKINLVLEEWIRDTPGQWIWMHNRWP